MKRLPIYCALVLLTVMGASAAPLTTQRIDDEPELHRLFAHRELSDNVHYSYRFAPDGRLSGEEMGRSIRGQWQIKDHGLCLNWSMPAGALECFEVRVAGREVQLLRHGREIYFGILVPLTSLRKAKPG